MAQTCADHGLSIVDTEAECVVAADALALGVGAIAVRHDSGARPAGCMDYTGAGAAHQLEFNSALDSTWSSSSWRDLYQICKTSVGRLFCAGVAHPRPPPPPRAVLKDSLFFFNSIKDRP